MSTIHRVGAGAIIFALLLVGVALPVAAEPADDIVAQGWWKGYKSGVIDGQFHKSSYKSGDEVIFYGNGLSVNTWDLKVVVSVCKKMDGTIELAVFVKQTCKRVLVCSGFDKFKRPPKTVIVLPIPEKPQPIMVPLMWENMADAFVAQPAVSEWLDRCSVERGRDGGCYTGYACVARYDPQAFAVKFNAPPELSASNELQVIVVQVKHKPDTRGRLDPMPVLPCPGAKLASEMCLLKGKDGMCKRQFILNTPLTCSLLPSLAFLLPFGTARASSYAETTTNEPEANGYSVGGENGETMFGVAMSEPVSRVVGEMKESGSKLIMLLVFAAVLVVSYVAVTQGVVGVKALPGRAKDGAKRTVEKVKARRAMKAYRK